ncbi:MAG: LCP family protein [Candidatus Sericytochromatia bacterium]|uniref:LCP family protein n=1 Tax=Candidatus Tanganyikabacteria bacterium TaxID=2961651 RepID=A0A938BLY7_9BACT|nr:LCP family protein [Candidatus Tanganyikabacteria bacterium]
MSLLVAAILGVGFGGASGVSAGYLLRPEFELAEDGTQVAVSQEGLGPLPFLNFDELNSDMTLLVMGVDATGAGGRGGLKANSDTMLLMRLAPGEGKIYAVSLPRDTRVRIPGHGTFKLNAAEAWGGPELAARTISNFLEVPIHRYFVVSLEGVVKAVDAIGGVDITVPKAMDYDDFAGRLHIHFKPGLQHMAGKDVEAFLRFRHDEIGSDVARVQRQQAFMMEGGRQFLKPSVALRLPALWSLLQNHAQTNLGMDEMLRIARWARHLDVQKDMTMTVLPGDYSMIKGVSYWTADPDALAPFLNAHFRDAAAGLTAEDRRGRPKVVIWDATGRRPRLKELERQLRDAGYMVWAVDRRKRRTLTTRVIVQRGDAVGGRELAATMGLNDVYTAAVGDLNSDFTLELGEDWTGDNVAATSAVERDAAGRNAAGQTAAGREAASDGSEDDSQTGADSIAGGLQTRPPQP